MTAEQHLQQAEAYLSAVANPTSPDFTSMDIAITLNGLTHAVIAVAIELGVPHAQPTSQGAGNGG